MKDRRLEICNIIEESIKEYDWSVTITYYSDVNVTAFDFRKYSPEGQDFLFEAEMQGTDVDSLLDEMNAKYDAFDCSHEAYLWLDESGHGKNGAPYDMKDVYEDMEACLEMMSELIDTIECELRGE